MSHDPVPFQILPALLQWLAVVGIILAISAVTLTVTSLATSGATGPLMIFEQIGGGIHDWLSTAGRRVWALTMLTFREAFRRKTLLVFVVFAILFLFAGWFLADTSPDPSMQIKVLVTFVLRAISWLILPVVLLLSCWGLPEDIRARSLHTVVTKPVYRHEVILGRIFGFSIVGGLVLVTMSVAGYIWILRQVPESAKSRLVARVPVYGALTFKDREGNDAAAGVNTGDEWMFRSYIEGNTKGRAIWDFQHLDQQLPSGAEDLLLESSFQVFRTYKGNIEKGILAQYILVNTDKKIRAALPPFEVHEFRDNVLKVERNLTDEEGKPVDLFNDLIHDGKLRVEVRCLTAAQFLGVARPDLFVRLPDRSFAVSYFKGIFGVGLMMVMIVVLGVTASSFVKGPIATILTLFMLLVGRMARPFFDELTSAQHMGGGVLESIYRIVKHLNPQTPLEDTLPNNIMQWIDSAGLNVMWALKYLFPDFQSFNMSEYVANGFDVPWSAAMLPSIALTVAYVIPWIILAHFSLKLRELEAK